MELMGCLLDNRGNYKRAASILIPFASKFIGPKVLAEEHL